MSLFPSLVTRRLDEPLVLYSSSCCPSMDVALLSNPTNSLNEASIQLYRLSGGSSNTSAQDADGLGNTDGPLADPAQAGAGASKVWATKAEGKAVLQDLKGKGRAKSGKANPPAQPEVYLQPRLPETAAWHPNGQVFAFGASSSNINVYSVYSGKPKLQRIPVPSVPPNTAMYFLGWEECLPPEKRTLVGPSSAEELDARLPGMSRLPKPDDKPAAPKNIFANPFLPGGGKPYTPTVKYAMPPFPCLVDVDPESPDAPEPRHLEDEFDMAFPDPHSPSKQPTSPTLLLAGDERGCLHFLFMGAIGLGSVALGKQTDVISAYLAGTSSTPGTPLTRERHTAHFSLLLSVPMSSATQSPPLSDPILAALPPKKSVPPEAQIVMRCTLDIPDFPSDELIHLARAATSLQAWLAHAHEALDDARKAWEEAREVGNRWLDRLRDDNCKMLPTLQLIMLLLTGRPPNTNLHDYLASKNTERNFERWETLHTTAVLKLRNTAFKSLLPACERVLLWLDLLRGWARWPRRFGALDLQLAALEQCAPLVRLIMLHATRLEALALEEQLGFRAFAGWIKFELERISSIEADSPNLPTPKHDVQAVTNYIKLNLLQNPLDHLVLVEKDTARYIPVVQAWIDTQIQASHIDAVKKEGTDKLPAILEKLMLEEQVLAEYGEDVQEMEMEEDAGYFSEGEDFILESERLLTDAPAVYPPPPQTATTPATRRKSTVAPPSDPLPSGPLVATELPLPYYLSDLTARLNSTLEHSFQGVSKRAVLRDATRVICWEPADREEDDSMTALGLARDPTKITSRVVRSKTEDDGTGCYQHWIACETPPGIIADGSQEAAFWLITVHPDKSVHAAAFSLRHSSGTTLEILDIEFFDDVEVAVLLRTSLVDSRTRKHSLATIRYQDVPLLQLDSHLSLSAFPDLPPIPFARVHEFASDFEPLQFALNGRQGRRVGCVLGNLGRLLEVLDMDEEEPDEDDAQGDGEVTAENGHMADEDEGSFRDGSQMGAFEDGVEEGDEEEDMDL